jgi:hypothetical protein
MTDSQQITYARMRDRLLAALAKVRPELSARGTDDFIVAVVDTSAVLAEILGFQAARLHEESALDLAVERDSVAELTRILGYLPDPGVAAIASLAFTLDDARGTPVSIRIPVGTAVMSTPLPGEVPVTFETVQEVEARPAWNSLRPRLGTHQVPGADPRVLLLAGTATTVLPGDGILVPDAGRTQGRFGVVTCVTTQPAVPGTADGPGRLGWTRVELALTPGSRPLPPGGVPTPLPGTRAPGPPLAALRTAHSTLDDAQVRAAATHGGFVESALFDALRDSRIAPSAVLVFRNQTGILGGGAPEWNSLPESLRKELTGAGASAPAPPPGQPAKAKPSASAVSQPSAKNNGGGSGSGSGGGSGGTITGSVILPGTTFTASSVYLTYYISANRLVWAEDSLEVYPGAKTGPAGDHTRRVFCDTVVKGVGPGVVVLRDGPTWDVYATSDVRTSSKSVFTVSGRSTVLTVNTGSGTLTSFGIRGTTVHLTPEWLPLAPHPQPSLLPGGTAGADIDLEDWAEGLYAGQRIAVTGRLHAVPSATRSHVTTITKVTHSLSESGTTSIQLRDALPVDLLRASVVINANVAVATHGQTRTEVLGNSDGRDPLPAYRLGGRPLTHVTTPDGSRPELKVWVGGVLRHQVPALLSDDEQGYVLREDDSGASIQFGSPLPSGVATVRAVYRTGLGSGARAGAGQLDLLTQRPPGVRSVTNPLPAEGGSDPETADSARRNAPASTRSLDRLVSLLDYEDHARAFPGIAKALGTWTRGAGRRGVLVTVAGDGGSPVPDDGDVHHALASGLATKGDPDIPVSIGSYRPVSLRLAARLRVAPERVADDVVAAARASLLEILGFARRDLGQPVSESEVLALLHAVPGVVAASLTELHRMVDGVPEGADPVQPFLRAHSPAAGALRGDPSQTSPAELLYLSPQEPPVLKVIP